MRVAVAAAGRFHAIRLAAQLAQRGYLEGLFTASFTPQDAQYIPAASVFHDSLCASINWWYEHLRLNHFIASSTINAVKDVWFDHFVKTHLNDIEEVDIFTAWAHYCLGSIAAIKDRSLILIIESGSSHILEQAALLQNDYDQWGVVYPPIRQSNKDRMLEEYAAADYIMTPSRFVFDGFVRQGIKAEKLLMVPCGVDTHVISTPPRELLLLPKKFRVIFVGLVSMRKGIHYLIEAWNRLNFSETQAELLIVGSVQRDIHQLLPRLKPQSTIKFCGPVGREKLGSLYHSSSVFVLPSIEDGFGMVIGEAMAHKLPVICTSNTGGPDIIEAGVHGSIIPPADVDALASALEWAFNNQEQLVAMGKKAADHIKKWNWDRYGDAIETTYKRILGEI